MDKKAALKPDLVQDFVRRAHGNIDGVKALLAIEPALASAAWDWGGGDFETGLGAAAHVGRRDIAELLLNRGARLDIFAAAMLGQLEIVTAALAAFPSALRTPGPHGISLSAHAAAGGEPARPVLAFLEAKLREPSEG